MRNLAVCLDRNRIGGVFGIVTGEFGATAIFIRAVDPTVTGNFGRGSVRTDGTGFA